MIRPTETCGHEHTRFVVTIASNAAHHVRRQCTACGHILPEAVAHAEITRRGLRLEHLEVVRDATSEKTCDVCGARGVELHHWAPEALREHFPQWTDWPTAWLCPPCHTRWHRAVTPELVQLRLSLGELGARRAMTLRMLCDAVRARLLEGVPA